jgi:hypothetical protein
VSKATLHFEVNDTAYPIHGHILGFPMRKTAFTHATKAA